MRFRFKSLLILSEREQRVLGGRETTTLYDLRNIGEHTFEASSRELRLHPIHLLATPLLASPVLALTLYVAAIATEGGLWTMPLVLLGALAGPLALFYPLSVHGLVNRRMAAQARRERLLAPSVQITVVRERDWESFRARLKQPDIVDEVALLCDQLAQLQRGQQPQVRLPDDDALQKWEGRAGEADNPPRENDKLSERPGNFKAGLGHPKTDDQGDHERG
jgi:hypothetical protein